MEPLHALHVERSLVDGTSQGVIKQQTLVVQKRLTCVGYLKAQAAHLDLSSACVLHECQLPQDHAGSEWPGQPTH